MLMQDGLMKQCTSFSIAMKMQRQNMIEKKYLISNGIQCCLITMYLHFQYTQMKIIVKCMIGGKKAILN